MSKDLFREQRTLNLMRRSSVQLRAGEWDTWEWLRKDDSMKFIQFKIICKKGEVEKRTASMDGWWSSTPLRSTMVQCQRLQLKVPSRPLSVSLAIIIAMRGGSGLSHPTPVFHHSNDVYEQLSNGWRSFHVAEKVDRPWPQKLTNCCSVPFSLPC